MPARREITVRAFTAADADAVAALIRATLLTSNASDYPREVLESLADWYHAEGLVSRLGLAHRLVATASGEIVGTAAVREGHVEGFFVAPTAQGRGVGVQLLAALEDAARLDGVAELLLESSLTAIPFYTHNGFVATGELADHGDGLSLPMRKAL
jgi:GNAT superfamily N-acetyltransferase